MELLIALGHISKHNKICSEDRGYISVIAGTTAPLATAHEGHRGCPLKHHRICKMKSTTPFNLQGKVRTDVLDINLSVHPLRPFGMQGTHQSSASVDLRRPNTRKAKSQVQEKISVSELTPAWTLHLEREPLQLLPANRTKLIKHM